MGSEVCVDEVMNEEVMCGNWNLICKVGDEESKNVAGPATPEENGEHNHDLSPSSPPPSSPNTTTSLETPKETLFDSFAPGSDKLLLAPHRRKYREESRNLVVRRLDFTSLAKDFSYVDTSDEELLFEIVYGTIMDTIFAEEAAAAGEGTPKSTPLLTGIADTCPAAPIKPAAKQRCIDKEICKKLEF